MYMLDTYRHLADSADAYNDYVQSIRDTVIEH